MNSKTTLGVLSSLLALTLASGYTQACETKSGKDCARTAAHKSDPKVKLGKNGAPASNVGATAAAGGVTPLGHAALKTKLGTPGAQVTGGQTPRGVTITDTYVYQLNGRTLTPFEAGELMAQRSMIREDQHGALSDKALAMGYTRVVAPNAVLATPKVEVTSYNYFLTRNGQTVPLTPRQVDMLRTSGFVLPDGQLSAGSQSRGFSAVAQKNYPTPAQAPVAVPNLAPGKAPTPDTPQLQVPQLVGTPDGWFYVPPHATGTKGRPASFQSLSRISSINVAHGRPAHVNPDGSLTAYAISQGWQRLNPVATPQHYPVPTPSQVVAPNVGPTATNAPQQLPPGQVPTAALPQAPQLHPVAQKTPGHIDYFLTRNGQTTLLNPQQVAVMKQDGFIKPDGSLSAMSLSHGFSMLDHSAPGRAPVPGQVAVPNLGPTAMSTPQQLPPGQVPVPGQVVAPNVGPTAINTPQQLPPGQVPTPNQVQVPPLAAAQAAAQPVPNQAAVSSGNGAALQSIHPHHVVEVYLPTAGALYHHEDAREIAHDEFHLVVVGFKEPQP